MKINKVYMPFIQAQNRYAILYGGAGSGKSHVAAQKILIRISSEKKHRILVVRKVARTLRASVFQMFRDLIAEEDLSHKFKINKSDMTIECIDTGSQLLFFGLDDVEKLKSIAGITSVWIEEASEVTQDDFDQLNLRLRVLRDDVYMQVLLTFNPVSVEHWLKKKFFDQGVEDTYIQKTTYKDNPFLPDEYLKVFNDLKATNPTFYKVYALGEWGTLKGQIYDNFDTIEKMPQYFEIETCGLDFGYNHPQAYVHVRIDGKDAYVDEVFYKSGTENGAFIEEIKTTRPDLMKLDNYADSARADLIAECEREGFNIMKAKKDVFAGINTVKGFRLHITSRSVNILREIKTYCWKTDKDGNSLDEPVKTGDDAMDAMRYAIFSAVGESNAVTSFNVKGL